MHTNTAKWFFFFLLACRLTCAQTTVAHLLAEATLARIRAYDELVDGVLGVAAIDLNTGRTLSYHGDVVFPQASSIKIPIMIQMYRSARAGEFRFTDSVTLTADDLVGGSGRLRHELKKGPVTLTVTDVVRAMIEHSDNTATNKCIRMVRTERVNRMLDELGFPSTRLRRMMMDRAAAGRNEENISTPLEMARLVELIYRGKVVDKEACLEMLETMKLVKAAMRKGVPQGVEVASKPGSVRGVKCETGIIFLPRRPFVLSVMSTYLGDNTKTPVTEVTGIVYAYFEKLARANHYGHRLR
jgi:beta-lactamase class A